MTIVRDLTAEITELRVADIEPAQAIVSYAQPRSPKPEGTREGPLACRDKFSGHDNRDCPFPPAFATRFWARQAVETPGTATQIPGALMTYLQRPEKLKALDLHSEPVTAINGIQAPRARSELLVRDQDTSRDSDGNFLLSTSRPSPISSISTNS